jgi:ketosteroid isomerase-like protein
VPEADDVEPAHAAASPVDPQADREHGPARAARSPLIYAAGAVTIVIAFVAGYRVMVRQPDPPPAVADSAPPPPTNQPSPSAATPAPETQTPAAAPPSAPAPPVVPETPAAAAPSAPTGESQVAPLRRLARQQFAAGTYPQALATAMSGLRLAPADDELQRVVSDLSNAARASVQRARQAAQAAGPAVVASPGFKDATARQELAARLARNRQVESSVKMYLEAADLFTAAATQARSAPPADSRATPPAPSNAPPAAAPPAASASTQPPAVTGPPAAAPQAAAPPPATERPTPPQTSPVPAAPPQAAPSRPPVQTPNDESLIRSTLQAYVQAYTNLDVNAVKRTYPAVDAAALSQAFDQMRSQRIDIEVAQVTASGNTATARCQVRQHFEPKAGRVNDSVVTATFSLQKTPAGWVILQRR